MKRTFRSYSIAYIFLLFIFIHTPGIYANTGELPPEVSPLEQQAPKELLIKYTEPVTIVTENGSEPSNEESIKTINMQTAPQSLRSLHVRYAVSTVKKLHRPSQYITAAGAMPSTNSPIYKITLEDESKRDEAIKYLRSFGKEIEHVQENFIYYIQKTPNDPYYLDSYPGSVGSRTNSYNPQYDYQWNMKKINIEKGWDKTVGSSSVTVAVLDTGVDYTHVEFGSCSLQSVDGNTCSKIAPGWNVIFNTSDAQDDAGHGTHVAGIIGAIGNNNTGIAGMDWNVRIMPIKVIDASGKGTSADIIDGINFAVDNGAKVINMSFGGLGKGGTLENDALNNAYAKGVTIVAAAGNEAAAVENYWPANFQNAIVVSALTNTDGRATYSNYGNLIDIAAPGTGILSLRAKNEIFSPAGKGVAVGTDYLVLSGTSMSCAHVSGLAALIISINSSYTPAQIETIIKNSAFDIGPSGFDTDFGYGRLDVYQALSLINGVSPTKTSSLTSTATQAPNNQDCMTRQQNGDYNCDGTVTDTDYVAWKDDYKGNISTLSYFEYWRKMYY